MDTQIAEVKRHLESGRTLNKMEAVKKPFLTTNLGDIVYKLRRLGYDIHMEMMLNLKSGKRYAEYFLK